MEKLDKLLVMIEKEIQSKNVDASEITNLFQYLKKYIEKFFTTITSETLLEPPEENQAEITAICNLHSGLLDAFFPLKNIPVSEDMLEALEDKTSYYTRGYEMAMKLIEYGIRYENINQSVRQLENGVIMFIDLVDENGNKNIEIKDIDKKNIEEIFSEWSKKLEEQMREIDEEMNDEGDDGAGEEWKRK